MTRRPALAPAAALLLLLAAAPACDGDGGGGPADAAGADTAAPDALDAAAGDDASGDAPGDAADDADDAEAGPALDPAPPTSHCAPNEAAFPVRPPVDEPATLPALRVEGTDLVAPDGTPVALRGINFGAWLQMETWIAGIGTKTEGKLLDELEARAEAAGLGPLLTAAREETALAWLLEQTAHKELVDRWRVSMAEAATPDQAAAVEALWAWFDSEPWIFEERSLWAWLTRRFGYARAEELRDVWHDTYITELDVERVAALGMNLVRVPIWYEQLESDEVGAVGFKADGWERLDRLARHAREHGVYLMLDLHGAPGGQSTSWWQGLPDGGMLWEREDCQARTANLWKALASYFAGDPHVAVYDLLNEPRPPDEDGYGPVHDLLYDAVRSVDPDTIVMAEDGYLPASWIKGPKELGWVNAMFSFHTYPDVSSAQGYVDSLEGSTTRWDEHWERFDCPIFLGEFNPADDRPDVPWTAEALDDTLAMLNARGVHWAPWTWKYYAERPVWGPYRPAESPGARIDVRDASFEEVKAGFLSMHSDRFAAEPGYQAAFLARTADPVSPQDLAP